MGREAICDCTFAGTTAEVKALLESEELYALIRGFLERSQVAVVDFSI